MFTFEERYHRGGATSPLPAESIPEPYFWLLIFICNLNLLKSGILIFRVFLRILSFRVFYANFEFQQFFWRTLFFRVFLVDFDFLCCFTIQGAGAFFGLHRIYLL